MDTIKQDIATKHIKDWESIYSNYLAEIVTEFKDGVWGFPITSQEWKRMD